MDICEPRLNAQTRILDAAEALVRERGVTGLTLEAAAQSAGLSKGGLLYHFASKDALIDGLLRRTADAIAADFADSVAAQPPGKGRVARAILAWGLSGPEDQAYERSQQAAAVFLAAFYHDPNLLQPIRTLFAAMRERAEDDGLPPGYGSAVKAAMDGLFLAKVFGLYSLGAPESRDVGNALQLLVEGHQA
jgi:AcrR family transcriptional regulator